MKRILSILLTLALCLGLLPFAVPAAEAAAGVSINSANFPDANFRAHVKANFDMNGDNVLSASELADAKILSAEDCGIQSLKGVEYFTALEELNCSGNRLTALDVSANTALVYLSCDFNELTALDVTGNTKLTSLWCGFNRLTSLDVTENKALRVLNCDGNELTALDVAGNTQLSWLSCAVNALTELDVGANRALELLSCERNALTALDVTGNSALTYLSCGGNALTELDVTGNPALDSLYCSVNALTALDVTANAELKWLECIGNEISALDIGGCPELVNAFVNGEQTQETLSESGLIYVHYSVGAAGLSVDQDTAVNARPVIITQPKAGTVVAGKTVTFSVEAAGAARYQWWYLKPGGAWTKVRNNGTSATYTLVTEPRHNGYRYRCVVTNAAGTAVSEIVELTVITAPQITTQPEAQTVAAGRTATFTVEATGSDLTYQWWYLKPGAAEWTKVIRNGTSATYSLTAKTRHDGYRYKCVVTNMAGSVASDIVTLTVVITPPVITTQPTDKTVMAGEAVTFKAAASGVGLSYQWWYLKPGAADWTRVIVGGTSATYTLVTEPRHDGYRYKCVVTNAAGTAVSEVVTLTVVTEPPVITTQPKAQTVTAGQTASFRVAADGAALSYQWWYRKPGSAEWTKVIHNGTSATYTLVTEPRHNGYQYKCVVSNVAGSVTSRIVTLTVK